MNLDRGRFAIGTGTLVLWVLALLTIPAAAAARTAYVTGNEEDGPGAFATPIELATQQVGHPVTIPVVEGAPPDVAITPDGTHAYVPNGFNAVVPIDVATNSAGTPIAVGSNPSSIAISPDGKTAYVTTSNNTVVPINLASGAPETPISVGELPVGIAITPDGSRAYVANLVSKTVSVIGLATGTVVATISVGSPPLSLAVTPDGSTVYLAEEAGVVPIDVATNTVGSVIPGSGFEDFDIAITPNGSRAYALEGSGEVVPIELGSGSAGTGIVVPAPPLDLAILPDGSRAYVSTSFPVEELVPIDLSTNTAGTPFAAGERPNAIAIVPNQPPHAAFTATVQGSGVAIASSTEAGNGAVAFNASASTDPDGTVGRYDWEFGDGATLANGGATPQHTYAKPGTYTVTLTTTDNEGCSTRLVFTGQTAYCNGSGVARVAHQVTIGAPPACTVVKGDASTFIPKRRPGRVSPGVRVKLSANAPAHLVAKAKLLWSLGGKSGSADLGKATVNIKQSGRVRFVIPSSLRGELPLGTPVTVKLRIEATPRGSSGCKATVANRTVHVHVVKVFPNRVQLLRAS